MRTPAITERALTRVLTVASDPVWVCMTTCPEPCFRFVICKRVLDGSTGHAGASNVRRSVYRRPAASNISTLIVYSPSRSNVDSRAIADL